MTLFSLSVNSFKRVRPNDEDTDPFVSDAPTLQKKKKKKNRNVSMCKSWPTSMQQISSTDINTHFLKTSFFQLYQNLQTCILKRRRLGSAVSFGFHPRRNRHSSFWFVGLLETIILVIVMVVFIVVIIIFIFIVGRFFWMKFVLPFKSVKDERA